MELHTVKRGVIAAKGLILVLFLSLSLCGCSRETGERPDAEKGTLGETVSEASDGAGDGEVGRGDENGEKGEEADASPKPAEKKAGEHPEDYYIKWAVPMGYTTVSPDILDEINYRLEQDGAGYGLQIEYINETDYQANLDKSGADIAFVGFDFENADAAATALEEGKYACLDELLKDSELYDAIPKILWDTVRYQGSIYYVPNEALRNDGICVLFDTEKIPLEKAKEFDGDIFTLEEYLPEGECLYYNLDEFRFAESFGYTYDKGLLFSNDGSVMSPLADERCMQWLRELHQWYADDRATHNPNLEEQSAIRLISDWDEEENLYKFAWKGRACPRLNLSIGIRADSQKKEEAFRFLELVHTDPSYANLLIYEQETLQDGEVIPGNWARQLIFGLDTGLLRVAGGFRSYASPEEKKKYYDENVIASPSLYMDFPKECQEVKNILYKYFVQPDIMDAPDFEGQLQKFQEEFQPVAEKVIEKIKELNQ